MLENIKESRNLKVYSQKGLISFIFNFVHSYGIDHIFMYLGTKDDSQELNNIFQGKVTFEYSNGIPHDFKLIGDFILSGGNIYPFKHDLQQVEEMAPFISEGFALILTRNFKYKQPFYNTKQSTLQRYIRNANKIGLSVINIGSPVLPFKRNVTHTFLSLNSFNILKKYKYLELNHLTYSQMLALAVKAKVWQVLPHAGGFSIHIASEANLIIEGPEFCKSSDGYWLAELRKRRTDLKTYTSFSDFKRDKCALAEIKSPLSINYEDKVINLE